jgi:hypothetical protein
MKERILTSYQQPGARNITHVLKLRYLAMTAINAHLIHMEINSKLYLGNAY